MNFSHLEGREVVMNVVAELQAGTENRFGSNSEQPNRKFFQERRPAGTGLPLWPGRSRPREQPGLGEGGGGCIQDEEAGSLLWAVVPWAVPWQQVGLAVV